VEYMEVIMSLIFWFTIQIIKIFDYQGIFWVTTMLIIPNYLNRITIWEFFVETFPVSNNLTKQDGEKFKRMIIFPQGIPMKHWNGMVNCWCIDLSRKHQMEVKLYCITKYVFVSLCFIHFPWWLNIASILESSL
jgi:hypothetical protein